jgi:hypothetical protein
MIIPSQFFTIHTNRQKPVKRGEVTLEKFEGSSDSTKQTLNAGVPMYEKREGQDRRKRNIKPLLDTRTGRDRRYDRNKLSINTKA